MVALQAADVESLVERARQDPEAFGALYDFYFDRIYRFAYSRLGDRGLAEDLTSEVFFKALRSLRQFRTGGGGFSAWLYRIAQNAIYDHYRSQRPESGLDGGREIADDGCTPDDQAEQRDRVQQVWTVLDRLPQSQRTATFLRFHEDLTIRQIADRLGRSTPAVKMLLHRAVSRIRTELAVVGGTV